MDPNCPGRWFYNYHAFMAATEAFPEFGNIGDVVTRKREIAAFFGQTSHETSGHFFFSLFSFSTHILLIKIKFNFA